MDTHPIESDVRPLGRFLAAGFTATLAMVFLNYLFRVVGLMAPEYGALYGAILGQDPVTREPLLAWWAGFLWHFLVGTIILPPLYELFCEWEVLSLHRRGGALLWSVIPWLGVELIASPLAGQGAFFRNASTPWICALTDLLAWAIYGVVLDRGLLAAHAPGVESLRRAA